MALCLRDLYAARGEPSLVSFAVYPIRARMSNSNCRWRLLREGKNYRHFSCCLSRCLQTCFGGNKKIPVTVAVTGIFLVPRRGFEPRTPCLKGRCSTYWANEAYKRMGKPSGFFWQGWLDSNQRMRESKSLALPLGYTPMRKSRWGIGIISQSLILCGVGKGTRTLDTRNHNPVL